MRCCLYKHQESKAYFTVCTSGAACPIVPEACVVSEWDVAVRGDCEVPSGYPKHQGGRGSTPETREQRKQLLKELEARLQGVSKKDWQERLEDLADERLKLIYGPIKESAQERAASWQSREVNRFITEKYRQRENAEQMRGVWTSIIFAFAVGGIAIVIGFMALPTRDSIFSHAACFAFGKFCDP